MESSAKFIFLLICVFGSISAKPQNSDAPPPITDDSTTPATVVECPEGNGQFQHPHFCDQFLNCWEGAGVVGKCEHGLYFNPANSTCDYPANVNCDGKEDSRPQMDQSVCPSGYGTFENADHCGQFIICHAGNVYVFNCPGGLVYNSTLGVCDYPAPEETCLQQHQQQPESTPVTPTHEEMPAPQFPQQPEEIPTSKIPNFDFATAIPVRPSGPDGNDANPVLFPVIPSWPKVNSYSLLRCPEGHRMGFIPANPVYAVCVKSDSLSF